MGKADVGVRFWFSYCLLLGIGALAPLALGQGAVPISGVSIEAFSSELPGAVQPCCDRRAEYLLTDTGLNINGPGTMTTAPDPGFMWLSDENPNIAAQFVTFDLGAVYDLDGARIWNYNENGILIRGVRQMVVRVSSDNVTFRNIGEYELAMAPSPATAFRDFSQYVRFRISDVRYVQFDVRSNWGDGAYVGLSKVRFFAGPSAEAPVSDGLVLHLDASDADASGDVSNQPAVGQAVATWADKSGQGNNAVATVGTPRFDRDAIHGHPAIRFNGADAFALPDFSGLTAGEIFVVIRPDNYPPPAPAQTGIWNFGTGGLQSHYSWIPGDARIYEVWGSDTRNETIVPHLPLNQWNVYNVASAPGAWQNALNGVTLRTRGTNTVSFPTAPLLGQGFASTFFLGAMAEVIMYDRTLSVAERAQVNDYLSRKYNIGAVYTEAENTPPITEGMTVHLDADFEPQVGNGNVLGRWSDRSGNALHANAVGNPVWVRNSLGGNPALRFNGADAEYHLGNLASRFPTGATVFVATSFNDDAYNLFSTKNDADPWWRWNGNGRSYSSAFRAPRAENFDDMPASGEFVYTIESTPNFWRMLQDNQPKAAVGAAYNAGNDYRISGGYGVGAKLLSGDIAEVLVYDRALSAEKQAEVQAYLSKKYRINTAASTVPVTSGRVFHLAADAIPNAVNGGVVTAWNDLSASALPVSTFGDPRYRDNRVNGKPTVEFDGAGDTFSANLSTSNTMTIFSVVRGTNYQSMIRWQPSNWLVYPWGNGDLIQTTNGGTGGGINAGLVPDEWNIATAVINTGVTNGVKTFRNGVLRGEKTFTAWGNLAPLWIGSINGAGEYMSGEMAELIVYHRALSDNERRQVERYLAEKYGLDGTGPAGLEKSDLELWLRADRGVVRDTNNVVSEWRDQSGFNHHIFQDVGAQRPDWVPNSVNGLPVVRFNPNGGAANQVEYFKSNAVWPGGIPAATGASLIFAARSNVADTFGYQSIIRYQGGTWLINPWYNTVIINEDSGTSGVATGLLTQQWNLSEGLFRANHPNGFQTFNRGSLVAQKASADVLLGANPLLVGACCGNEAINGESPNADVGEVITYSHRLNDARRVLLQNYLSARLDIPLNANNVYAGSSPANGDYDWDVAGIGRLGNPVDFGDGANPLGAGRHLFGQSAGMIVEEINYLQDSGDFIVIGHNGAPNNLTNADLAGSGAQKRWSRIWYLDKSDVGGNGGQVRITFDMSAGKAGGLNSGALVLLRRNGLSGDFAVIANTPSVLGDRYSFVLNANGLSDGYYTVAEVDTTPPVITLTGGDMTIECGAGYTDPGFSAQDNSDGDITSSVVLSGATVNPGNPGVYVVRYNVSDTAGNSAIEVTRTVTVQDTTAPIITRNGAAVVNVECGSPYVDAGATAFDACDLNLTSAITVGGLGFSTATTGTHQVTYNVTDSEGIPAVQVTRTVNVVDTTPPTLTLNGTDMIIECGATFTDPGASATDVCAGSVPVVVGGTVDPSTPDVYVLTYNATDGTNAAAQQTRTVTVVDTLGPVITLNGSANQTVVAGQGYTDPGATAVDACEGAVAVVVGGDVVNPNVVDTYVITYDAQDSGGRAATQLTRTVNIVAGNPPEISLLGDAVVTLECGDSYSDAGAVATDVEDDDTVLTSNIVVGGLPIPTGVPGNYTVTYNVTDSSGNPASQETRTVIVEDTQAPALTLQGSASVTLSCGDSYSDAGATASDVCDDNISLTANIVTTGLPIPVGTPGVYTVTYNVSDAEGNAAAQVTRTVEVVDNDAPVLTLNGAAVVTIDCGDNYQDAGATATDVCDNDAALTSAIVVSGLPVNTNVLGPKLITYNVQDQAGNNAVQISRTVIVEDNAPPVINLNGAAVIQIDLGGQYNEPGASANDACEGDLPVVIGGDVVDTSTAGTYIITYNAQDSSGNAAVQRTRQVVVIAGEAPVIVDQPFNQVVNYGEDATFTVSAVALGPISYEWLRDGVPLVNGPDFGGVSTETLTIFDAENGDEAGYACRVTSLGIPVLSVVAQLEVIDPGITLQPVGQVVAPGSVVQFEIAAAGSGTLSYQWFRDSFALSNGGRISGADGPILTINDANKNLDEGAYYCVVDGGEDPAIESDRADLIVGNPLIVQDPVSIEVLQGSNAVFEVEVVGVPPLVYVWQKNGQNLVASAKYSGISTPTLTIFNVDASDEAEYRCRVVGQNIVQSNNATLKVLGPPVIDRIERIPGNGIVPLQGPAAFTVILSDGATPFAYQWRKDGVPLSNNARISGVDAATLTISDSVLGDAGGYDCVVSNGAGTVISNSLSLSVGLTFTQNLGPAIGEQGSFFQWSVNVAGSLGEPNYQWFKNDDTKAVFTPLADGGGISGTTTNTLNFNPLEFSDAGQYQVQVTDNFSTYNSNPAFLQVVVALPVAALAWLATLAALLALGGIALMRRRGFGGGVARH